MKKLNKKGFTLIEMLVVIAIIAILVAIIIPIVSSATEKAAAATDAANLRSYKAEIVTSYLSNDGKVTVDGSTVTCNINSPAMKAVKSLGVAECEASTNGVGSNFAVTYTNGDFSVTYGGKTINDFAAKAGSTQDKQGGSGT